MPWPGLSPKRAIWSQKYPATGKPQRPEVTIAIPRISGDRIFVSSFYHGALMVEVTNSPIGSRIAWDRHSTNQNNFEQGLHTTMTTPVWKGDYIYGLCGGGELRCLDAKTGDSLWENNAAVGGEPGLFAARSSSSRPTACSCGMIMANSSWAG